MNKINRRFHIRTKLFFILWLLLPSSPGRLFAQDRDSLRKILSSGSLTDSARIITLGMLAEQYENANTDSMIIIANDGIRIAERVHFEKGKVYCETMLGLAYLHKSEYELSLRYYKNALAFYEKAGKIKGQSKINLCIADIYYRQGNYAEALEYYKKGIAIYDQLNNPTGKGFALISIGGIYNDIGNYAEALDFYFQSLNAFEKDSYSPGIIMSLSTIATVYASVGDNKKAIEYLDKSLAIDDSKCSKEQKMLSLTNIATVYTSTKDYGKALQFYNKCVLVADSTGDDTWENSCRSNIADVFFLMKQYDTALVKYAAIKKIGEKTHDTSTIISAGRGIGRILIIKGKVSEGIGLLRGVMDLAQGRQREQIVFETAFDLSNAYEKKGDYTNALLFHKLYADTKDSLFNEKNITRIEQLQFDYELGKKESQIELLKKDKVIAQSKSEQQKVETSALFMGIALLIAISIILFRGRAYEKRSKDKIVKQKEEIQQQASELEELNNFKDKTFSVLSHDLRSPLGALTSTMLLLDNQLISADEFAMLKPELNRQLSSLNILLDNLLNWSKSYIQGKTPAKPVSANVRNMVSQNIRLLNDTAAGKQITLANNVEESTDAFCDPGQIDIVIRNLISNAIKFTAHNGTVTISSTGSQDDKVRITIADNGIGMTSEQLSKVFTTAIGNTTYGTDGERGIGIGLLLCYEFVKANNGNISVASEVGKGTVFTIELPKVPGPEAI